MEEPKNVKEAAHFRINDLDIYAMANYYIAKGDSFVVKETPASQAVAKICYVTAAGLAMESGLERTLELVGEKLAQFGKSLLDP